MFYSPSSLKETLKLLLQLTSGREGTVLLHVHMHMHITWYIRVITLIVGQLYAKNSTLNENDSLEGLT